MTKKISLLTKRDILRIFKEGIFEDYFFDTIHKTYKYFGCLSEIEFLKRLFILEDLPSYDKRYINAEFDIVQHTINNDDYEYCWSFSDDRFNFNNGEDEVYLNFLCEIFHPEVRDENEDWRDFLSKVNLLLRNDGYELFSNEKISGREKFIWRVYDKSNYEYSPLSERYQELIKKNKFTLSKVVRSKILKIINAYDFIYRNTDETGWNYDTWLSLDFLKDINKFYTPCAFNESNEYVKTDSIEGFIMNNYPYYVFDIIEYFSFNLKNEVFDIDINNIFNSNQLKFTLKNNKIHFNDDFMISNDLIYKANDTGLMSIINEANKRFNSKEYSLATEKIWDAFERIKTHYYPDSKKNSIDKLIRVISLENNAYFELFEKEFKELTRIGNEFRIRHHEKDKTDINDERHFTYLFKRCSLLISFIMEYIRET